MKFLIKFAGLWRAKSFLSDITYLLMEFAWTDFTNDPKCSILLDLSLYFISFGFQRPNWQKIEFTPCQIYDFFKNFNFKYLHHTASVCSEVEKQSSYFWLFLFDSGLGLTFRDSNNRVPLLIGNFLSILKDKNVYDAMTGSHKVGLRIMLFFFAKYACVIKIPEF